MTTGFDRLAGLLTATGRREDALAMHIGLSLRDIVGPASLSDPSRDAMRELCGEAVRERACAMLGMDDAALAVAQIVGPAAPLAASVGEIETAIGIVGAWIADMTDDGLFERIVQIKSLAAESGTLDIDPDELDEDARAAWETSMTTHAELAERGMVRFPLGGREIMAIVESEATLLVAHLTDAEWMALCSFPHTIDEDGWEEGDDGDGPDPDPSSPPGTPVAVRA